MAGSTFGTLFSITTFGESHGEALGVVIDGCPAGLTLTPLDIQAFLDRRKPGQSAISTPRKEADAVQILSGVFEGKTTGTPIALLVPNTSQRSSDYSQIANCYRPGHADYTYDTKYGFRDYRGGGRSSARETIARVAAGAVACKLLAHYGITVTAYVKSIGEFEIDPKRFDLSERNNNSLNMPDKVAAEETAEFLERMIAAQDSVGGVVECLVDGMPVGVGEPVFDKLDASLARAIMSIGAVKGFEIGDGFAAAKALGSQNNDEFYVDADGKVAKKTNHAGGILGGMSDGSQIVLRAAFKPTPSIAQPQKTANNHGENVEIAIKGRHDPVVVPRAVVVVEAMTALTILDLLLMGKHAKLD